MRGWSSIWDAGHPTPLAADPKAGRRTPVQLAPHVPSYLALHQVELARFTRPSPKARPTRLCGASPHLAVDGSYPLPRVVVLGLSSNDESPRRPRPSGHLTDDSTVAPAQRKPSCDRRQAFARPPPAFAETLRAVLRLQAGGSGRIVESEVGQRIGGLVGGPRLVRGIPARKTGQQLPSLTPKHAQLGVLDSPSAV